MQEQLKGVIEAVRQEGIEAMRRHQARVAELETLLQAEKLAAARAEGLVANLPYLLKRLGAVIIVDTPASAGHTGDVSRTHAPNPEDFIGHSECAREYPPRPDGPRGDFRAPDHIDHSTE